MDKNKHSSSLERLLKASRIPEEIKQSYVDILPFLPKENKEKMKKLLEKEQLILNT